jgi:hypothetical protein
MAKTNTTKSARKTRAPKLVVVENPIVEALVEKAEALVPATEAIDQQEGYLVRKGSVVKKKFKLAYKAGGDSRGNKDWLFTLLKGATLDANGKADIAALQAIADENGVPSAYANRSAGWQGRMRMTIGLRLRSVVAKRGYLVLAGEKVTAPESFCQAWRGNAKAAEVEKEEEAAG